MEDIITRDGFQIFYKKDGSGPLIVIIHGVACDSSYFCNVIPYLTRHFTVIVYDRRGYSKSISMSNSPDEILDYSIAAQAADAAMIIEKQKVGAAFVVGCSAGGLVAIELAQNYPRLVRGLFLQEPPLAGSTQAEEWLSEWMMELREAAAKKQINKALLSLKKVMGGVDESAKSKSLESQLQDLENYKIFLYKEMEEFLSYKLNEVSYKQDTGGEGILKFQTPCVIGIGECNREGLFAKVATTAAESMGWKLVRTPGYHNFPADLPYEFALFIIGIVCGLDLRIHDR